MVGAAGRMERLGERALSALAYGPVFLVIGVICFMLPADNVYNPETVYTHYRTLLVQWGLVSTALYLLGSQPVRRHWSRPLGNYLRDNAVRSRYRSIKRYVMNFRSVAPPVDYYRVAERADYSWEAS